MTAMQFRRLGLALALAVILTAFVPVTAQADEYDPWTDLAEVCTVNNSGSNYFGFYDKTTVTLSPGFETIVGRIDMIWFCGYGAPESVYIWRNEYESSRKALTIEQISGSYYRIYGSIGNYTLSDYRFDVDCGTTGKWYSYEIKTCRIIEGNGLTSLIPNYTFDDGYLDESAWTQDGVHMPANGVSEQSGRLRSYLWDLWVSDWILYDYLDLYIMTDRASINSIAITQGGISIPFTVTPLVSDNATTADGSYVDTPLMPSVCTVIHIDLTTATRSIGNDPHIYITGQWNDAYGGNLRISSLYGYIQTPTRTGPAYWFERATAFLSQLFGGDSTDADEFESDMAHQGQEMQDAVDQMDQVTKPPVEDIDVSLDSYVSPDDMAQVGSIFGAFFENPLILTMVLISLTASLGAFIIFGKR